MAEAQTLIKMVTGMCLWACRPSPGPIPRVPEVVFSLGGENPTIEEGTRGQT